ncbi:protein DEHYDRATION-INDUCED 19 homolog 3 isoform X2 [Cynara cardunculus var. scolymus]|uniref:protein DEHYDRATION-INDUCED 19 homolog 3 isoform X2 n=1 Tax=Cynara cardunculus var. scolymus TaxID=59895 RepID=UPI000D629EA9|nr:protein DEHYDRATION-INDUCED 19 homolog 3 isoform X2 [Cynara cardunculus var. scolymus]
MDADSWIARLSSTSRRYQHALQSRSSDTFMGFEDIEVDDDIREEIQCSFCGGYFDITCLCCHISEEHPVEAKNGKRKSCRGGSISMLSLLRRELREGNLQSNSGGSSYIVSSANAAPDPLLSSFISPMGDDLVINSSKSLVEPTVVKKSTIKNLPHSKKSESLSSKDKEERSRRCEFVQGMLLSTILDDI